jgi:uncharacterized membrane protein YjjB (DUF3815 family)
MNKYQKQALKDMGKVAGIVLLVITAVAVVIRMGMNGSDLLTAGSFGLMGYCIYQLYLVRVGQLESEDKNK